MHGLPGGHPSLASASFLAGQMLCVRRGELCQPFLPVARALVCLRGSGNSCMWVCVPCLGKPPSWWLPEHPQQKHYHFLRAVGLCVTCNLTSLQPQVLLPPALWVEPPTPPPRPTLRQGREGKWCAAGVMPGSDKGSAGTYVGQGRSSGVSEQKALQPPWLGTTGDHWGMARASPG